MKSTSTPRVNLKSALTVVVGFLGIFWISEIVDQLLLSSALDQWGIQPREPGGLLGIFLAPFLHGGFGHLIANSLPFLVLGGLIAARGVGRFLGVSLFVTVVSGLAVWGLGNLFASGNPTHIGASGLVFGYFGYLVMTGWYERSIKAVLIAALVAFFYGGLIWGVLPNQPGISWEGHLFGMLSGAVAARALASAHIASRRQRATVSA